MASSSFSSLPLSPTKDELTKVLPVGKIPTSEQKNLDYLEAWEQSRKMSRREYLKSLETEASPVVPNLAPVAHENEFFCDEPKNISSGWVTRFAFWKYMLCNRQVYIATSLIILLSSLVTVLVVGLRPQSDSPGTVDVGTSSNVYSSNDDILIKVVASKPKSSYWVGIWQAERAPGPTYTESDTRTAMWMSLCTGGDDTCAKETTLQFSEGSGWKSEFTLDWPLCNGAWAACIIDDDSSQNVGCSEVFAVVGGTCEGVCKPATSALSKIEHLNPTHMTPLSKIAFGSCFDPENQVDARLWQHMREVFQPDLWVWLGDNAYADGENIEVKRATYNANKQDLYYTQYGPVAHPKIPATGTWDSHDASVDNAGAEYQCHKLAQDEFAYWFNLPSDDPRHPSLGPNQQKGVYSSIMFSTPDEADINGVHLILLDVRYHRSPTFKDKGYCEGADSTVLGQEQWNWLGHELKKKSKVKIIGTGMQVMQPTDQFFTDVDSYCANDNKTFFEAIAELEETELHLGTKYESWSQIPQERLRLLRYLQRAISDGFAEKIIIISGDMQWGEVMAKKMPAADDFGGSQIIYEVTASGIDKNFPYPDPNANRLKIRSADTAGDGIYQHECKFPFKYEGVEYNDCIMAKESKPWCATLVDAEKNYLSGDWGYCLPEGDELVPRVNITASGEKSCYEALHVCKAQANYGGIEVDWNNSLIHLYLFTPHETNPVAGKVTIGM